MGINFGKNRCNKKSAEQPRVLSKRTIVAAHTTENSPPKFFLESDHRFATWGDKEGYVLMKETAMPNVHIHFEREGCTCVMEPSERREGVIFVHDNKLAFTTNHSIKPARFAKEGETLTYIGEDPKRKLTVLKNGRLAVRRDDSTNFKFVPV
jgi:hypothetical protein